jgi:hypothetical protein
MQCAGRRCDRMDGSSQSHRGSTIVATDVRAHVLMTTYTVGQSQVPAVLAWELLTYLDTTSRLGRAVATIEEPSQETY